MDVVVIVADDDVLERPVHRVIVLRGKSPPFGECCACVLTSCEGWLSP
jgi:hypothetical protein